MAHWLQNAPPHSPFIRPDASSQYLEHFHSKHCWWEQWQWTRTVKSWAFRPKQAKRRMSLCRVSHRLQGVMWLSVNMKTLIIATIKKSSHYHNTEPCSDCITFKSSEVQLEDSLSLSTQIHSAMSQHREFTSIIQRQVYYLAPSLAHCVAFISDINK